MVFFLIFSNKSAGRGPESSAAVDQVSSRSNVLPAGKSGVSTSRPAAATAATATATAASTSSRHIVSESSAYRVAQGVDMLQSALGDMSAFQVHTCGVDQHALVVRLAANLRTPKAISTIPIDILVSVSIFNCLPI